MRWSVKHFGEAIDPDSGRVGEAELESWQEVTEGALFNPHRLPPILGISIRFPAPRRSRAAFPYTS
jgi:hypothetical protein